MTSRHHPSGQPSSPWAQIFYPSRDPFWSTRGDGLAHSGLAPEYPALTRDNLGDGKIVVNGLPKPSPADLDRLFYGERQQRDALGGLMTWQMGALREKFYTFEQATQHDTRCLDSLTIDEATWFPCFRKDRWLDHPSSISQHLRNPIAGILAGHPTDRMTVDNPLVWSEMRVCIEIANRILSQLIHSRNCLLDALLFGDRLDWAAIDADVMAFFLGGDDEPPKVVYQRAPDLVASSQELRTKLEELSKDVLWGFMDEDSQPHNGCLVGLSVEIHAAQVFQTEPPDASNHGGLTSQNGAFLHVVLLRSLWEADTPLVERCSARLSTAITLVHELMHCLGRAKEPLEEHEPYIYPYAARELGKIAELAAFGRQIAAAPLLYHPDIVGSGASTVLLTSKWPSRGEVLQQMPLKHQPPWEFEDICFYSIPSEWTTAMQSQPYWLDVVSRWGPGALHPPLIFRSAIESPLWYIGYRRHNAYPVQLRDVPTEMRPLYLQAVQRWRSQYVAQGFNRPWWKAESVKWERSPWSWVTAREAISQFREQHRKRDLAQCVLCINKLWYHNGNDQEVWKNPTTWLFRCICHLMMTSIPMPQEPLSRQGRFLRISGTTSQEAASRLDYHGEFRAFAEDSPRAGDVAVAIWPFIPDTSTSLRNFYALFSISARMWPQPWIWLDTCWRTFLDLHRDGAVFPTPDVWLPFNFSIPDYVEITQWVQIQSETEGFTRQGHYPIITYGAMPPPSTNQGRFVSPPRTPPQPDLLPDASVSPARYEMLPGTSGGAPASQPVASRYFTVGIVGNHMYGDSFWVVEPDGAHGYDIFRISEKCKELGYHTADHIRRELITVGPLGPSLLKDRHPHAEAIRREFRHSLHPLGKLLVRKKLEVIAEHNGQNDMPLWIVIGSDVYDITEFPFDSDEEEDQLRSNPGGVPKTLSLSDDDYVKLFDRLLPFKCALVDGTKGSKKPVLEPYTPAMLRWHDSPTDGMYTAIEGIVYDITGYYESHPGGSDILMADLGKESTEFLNHHDAELMDDYADLALGRLVPEIPAGQLGRHQIALQGWVYDLSRLNRDEHWFLAAVQPLGGQDASAALAGDGVDAITASALAHLVEHEKGRVVGGLAAAVPRGEGSTIPSGELARHGDPQRVHGGWVAVDGRVYDLTAVMRHGARFYGRDVPWYWAGREVTDPDLGRWIRATLAHRVVGRLVEGEAWPAGFGGEAGGEAAGEAEDDNVVGGKRKRSRSQDGVDGEKRPKCKGN